MIDFNTSRIPTVHRISDGLPSVYQSELFGSIRVITQDNEFWFVAKDIAEILGYSDTNALTRHLDMDESMSVKLTGMNMSHTLISEPGIYNAIIRSRVEGAKAFKRWITHEILPSIRKHGFYGTDNFIENALADPAVMISMLEKYQDEREQRRLAEQQRDYAIETKAWIGKKREATAMNTASQYSKENKRLLEQLGNAKEWKQAKAIAWLNDFFVLSRGAYSAIGKRKRFINPIF